MDNVFLNYGEILQLQMLVDHELEFVSGLIIKNDYFSDKEELLKSLHEKLFNLALKYNS